MRQALDGHEDELKSGFVSVLHGQGVLCLLMTRAAINPPSARPGLLKNLTEALPGPGILAEYQPR